MRNQNRYSETDYKQWLTLAEAFTVSEISRICNVPGTTIRSYLHRQGIEPIPATTFSKLTHRDYDVPVFMYCELKMSVVEIAEQMNLHSGTIRFRLKRAGVLMSQAESLKRAYEMGRRPRPVGKVGVQRVLTAA